MYFLLCVVPTFIVWHCRSSMRCSSRGRMSRQQNGRDSDSAGGCGAHAIAMVKGYSHYVRYRTAPYVYLLCKYMKMNTYLMTKWRLLTWTVMIAYGLLRVISVYCMSKRRWSRRQRYWVYDGAKFVNFGTPTLNLEGINLVPISSFIIKFTT